MFIEDLFVDGISVPFAAVALLVLSQLYNAWGSVDLFAAIGRLAKREPVA